MRITDVKTVTLAHTGTPIMSSVYVLGHWKSVIVEVHTDEGLVGIGEAESFGWPDIIRTII